MLTAEQYKERRPDVILSAYHLREHMFRQDAPGRGNLRNMIWQLSREISGLCDQVRSGVKDIEKDWTQAQRLREAALLMTRREGAHQTGHLSFFRDLDDTYRIVGLDGIVTCIKDSATERLTEANLGVCEDNDVLRETGKVMLEVANALRGCRIFAGRESVDYRKTGNRVSLLFQKSESPDELKNYVSGRFMETGGEVIIVVKRSDGYPVAYATMVGGEPDGYIDWYLSESPDHRGINGAPAAQFGVIRATKMEDLDRLWRDWPIFTEGPSAIKDNPNLVFEVIS